MTVQFNQNGYIGSSMSVRAAEAYENGEMPKSKWTKAVMLEAIAYAIQENDLEITDEQWVNIKKMNKESLFNNFFEWSSWHHTSKYANETDFYSINEDALEDVVEERKQCKINYEVRVTLGHHNFNRFFDTEKKRAAWLIANGFNADKKVQVSGNFEIRCADRLV